VRPKEAWRRAKMRPIIGGREALAIDPCAPAETHR
jgi:hypothetical protein